MKLFGTFVLGTAVGFVACGALTVKGVLSSERHRKALAKMVSEKVSEELFTKKSNDCRVSYVEYPKKPCPSRVSYRSYHDKERVTMNAERGPIEIKFERGIEADTALDHIKELMKEYGQATVADVCDICELDSNYTDNKYGWTHTSGMNILAGGDGYMLCLPKPLPLE